MKVQITMTHHKEGNFGATRIWQNWRLTKNLPNFHHPNFHTSIVKFHVSVILPPHLKSIKQIEEVFLDMCPTTCRVPSIIFLIATACRSCEFPFLVHEVSLHLLQDYPIWIGSHGSLEPLNLYKTCKLSFHTFIAHN